MGVYDYDYTYYVLRSSSGEFALIYSRIVNMYLVYANASYDAISCVVMVAVSVS